MKPKIWILFLASFLLLSACGQKTLSEPVTLLNQDLDEVTFPQEKPTVFFFITSYT
ncbi:lipoprotein [Neobacillus niacini]|uniref:lipoprotein n=1 Tax=Neobacillus niacini TaxID=86668 RepID=UPI0021CB67ED|nr:lipoprotein [Neobacillus niacini]MCM3765581.1 lipoprotein [Neobacillus niacini]